MAKDDEEFAKSMWLIAFAAFIMSIGTVPIFVDGSVGPVAKVILFCATLSAGLFFILITHRKH